jgi:hypothetical protein
MYVWKYVVCVRRTLRTFSVRRRGRSLLVWLAGELRLNQGLCHQLSLVELLSLSLSHSFSFVDQAVLTPLFVKLCTTILPRQSRH